MSGIYFHIPFCKTRCHYCDFHTTSNFSTRTGVIEAMKKEMKYRTQYLSTEDLVETIYFGGGTPSILSTDEIEEFIKLSYQHFSVVDNPEITLEANPDDLTEKFIQSIAKIGVNRLSMGVQSLNNGLLKFMNRRHSADQAIEAVENCIKYGIDNISIDLIYGIPGLDKELWKKTLSTALSLPVTHLSAYHLTYHKGTKFYNDLKLGNISELDDEESLNQFKLLIEFSKAKGFEQYEISNFAKKGLYSKHNSSYWKGINYIGIGPSAHSFNGESRQWNIANNMRYIERINLNQDYFELEKLSIVDKYNDYIITTLRTKWGTNLNTIEEYFGSKYVSFFEKNIQSYCLRKCVEKIGSTYRLTHNGIFISDAIISDVFYIE